MGRRRLEVIVSIGLTLCAAGALDAATAGFVTRDGTQFDISNQPYYYVGASYYNAMNLAADCASRPQLDATFARLAALGVTNVRIWASSEGAGGPTQLTPTLQPTQGAFNETLFRGLDYALKCASDHGLRAVMVLNNNWDWSGGMNQYVTWSPTTNKGLTNDQWGQGAYHDQFYTDCNCIADYEAFISTVVNRQNTAYPGGSQPLYRDDPTIFSWELANEPRAFKPTTAQAQATLNSWINSTASYIKSLDPNHMVATGSEGFLNKTSPAYWWENPQWTGTDFVANHLSTYVDYATVHIWPFNWGWYPSPDSDNLTALYNRATAFLVEHLAAAQASLGKPLVLEEFGLLRDNDHDGNGQPPLGPTTQRDELFRTYYNILYASASSGGPGAGSNFWTYADDPPQEAEGLNAVYDPHDNSTLNVIAAAAALMSGLIPARGDANRDGKVDGADLAVWQQNYDPLGLGANTWAMGDWNGDGKIDGGDLALWQQNYNPLGLLGLGPLAGDGAPLADVPEPATLVLMLAGVFCLVRTRRR